MTEAEVCTQYRLARYKKAQIKVLAELNLVPCYEIERILAEHGYIEREKTLPVPKDVLDKAIKEIRSRGFVIDFDPIIPEVL